MLTRNTHGRSLTQAMDKSLGLFSVIVGEFVGFIVGRGVESGYLFEVLGRPWWVLLLTSLRGVGGRRLYRLDDIASKRMELTDERMVMKEEKRKSLKSSFAPFLWVALRHRMGALVSRWELCFANGRRVRGFFIRWVFGAFVLCRSFLVFFVR